MTKYRYKVLTAKVTERVRKLVRQVSERSEIKTLKGMVSKDPLHILVSAPSAMAHSEIMRRLKGNTSSRQFEEFSHLKKSFLEQHFEANPNDDFKK